MIHDFGVGRERVLIRSSLGIKDAHVYLSNQVLHILSPLRDSICLSDEFVIQLKLTE